jgi:hypothetical protein
MGVDVVLVVDGDGDLVRHFSPGSPHFVDVAVAVNAHDNVNGPKISYLGQ